MSVLKYTDLVLKRLAELNRELAEPRTMVARKDILWLIDCNERMLVALTLSYQGHSVRMYRRIAEVHSVYPRFIEGAQA